MVHCTFRMLSDPPSSDTSTTAPGPAMKVAPLRLELYSDMLLALTLNDVSGHYAHTLPHATCVMNRSAMRLSPSMILCLVYVFVSLYYAAISFVSRVCYLMMLQCCVVICCVFIRVNLIASYHT